MHADYGVLWGEYITLARSPFKLTTLLGKSIGTIDKWPGLTRDWTTKKAG